MVVDIVIDDCVSCWQTHAERLPAHAVLFEKVVTIQPSSAASERVLSMLNGGFNDSQQTMLSDMKELSIMNS